jgi:hypothetical protein
MTHLIFFLAILAVTSSCGPEANSTVTAIVDGGGSQQLPRGLTVALAGSLSQNSEQGVEKYRFVECQSVDLEQTAKALAVVDAASLTADLFADSAGKVWTRESDRSFRPISACAVMSGSPELGFLDIARLFQKSAAVGKSELNPVVQSLFLLFRGAYVSNSANPFLLQALALSRLANADGYRLISADKLLADFAKLDPVYNPCRHESLKLGSYTCTSNAQGETRYVLGGTAGSYDAAVDSVVNFVKSEPSFALDDTVVIGTAQNPATNPIGNNFVSDGNRNSLQHAGPGVAPGSSLYTIKGLEPNVEGQSPVAVNRTLSDMRKLDPYEIRQAPSRPFNSSVAVVEVGQTGNAVLNVGLLALAPKYTTYAESLEIPYVGIYREVPVQTEVLRSQNFSPGQRDQMMAARIEDQSRNYQRVNTYSYRGTVENGGFRFAPGQYESFLRDLPAKSDRKYWCGVEAIEQFAAGCR